MSDVNNEQTELTREIARDAENGRFVTGNIGGGRPKGSRNKLGEQFIQDLYSEWQESGVSALKRVAADDPTAFVRLVAGVLPRELDATLTVSSEHLELFAECRDYAAAFKKASEIIGSELVLVEEPALIEAPDDAA